MIYFVDWRKQSQEKNISWRDYPTFGIDSLGRKRKGKTLRHYYDDWAEYIKTENHHRKTLNEFFTQRALSELI